MDLQPSEASNSDPQEAQGAETTKHHQPRAARHRHLVFDIAMAGGAGLGAYFLYEHLTISPSAPSNLQASN